MTAIPVILDTDISGDVDDDADVKMAAVLHQLGMIKLLGVTVCTTMQYAPAAVDAILTYMGLPDRTAIPVGVTKDASAPSLNFTDVGGAHQNLYTNFPHTLGLTSTVTDALTVLRTLLAARSTNDVYILGTGMSRNFSNLLSTAADGISGLTGTALVTAKVKRLVHVAGLFPTSTPADTNFSLDPAAGNTVATTWPTPIWYLGEEQGQAIILGSTMQTDLTAADPVREVYRLGGATSGRPGWAAVAFHLLLRRPYWRLVQGTQAVNSSTGVNTFTVGNGTHFAARRQVPNGSLLRVLDSLLLSAPNNVPAAL